MVALVVALVSKGERPTLRNSNHLRAQCRQNVRDLISNYLVRRQSLSLMWLRRVSDLLDEMTFCSMLSSLFTPEYVVRAERSQRDNREVNVYISPESFRTMTNARQSHE